MPAGRTPREPADAARRDHLDHGDHGRGPRPGRPYLTDLPITPTPAHPVVGCRWVRGMCTLGVCFNTECDQAGLRVLRHSLLLWLLSRGETTVSPGPSGHGTSA